MEKLWTVAMKSEEEDRPEQSNGISKQWELRAQQRLGAMTLHAMDWP